MAKKVGRPSIYTEDLASEICHRLCMGESLRGICEDDDMPDRSTVLLWVTQDREGFSHQYAQARQVQAHIWAEEILAIADNESKDWRVDEDGNLIVEREQVQRSRLRVDTRKWLLSRVLPKVYGDKVALEHSAPGGGPVEIAVTRKVVKTNRIAEHTAPTNGDGRA